MDKKIKEISVICDSCNSSFSPNDIVVDEKFLSMCGDRVRVIYYRCPKCRKVHLIGIHDYRADKLLKRQQELVLSNQRRVNKGLPVSKEKLEQIESIKDELLLYQDTLKERYKNGIDLLDQLLEDK